MDETPKGGPALISDDLVVQAWSTAIGGNDTRLPVEILRALTGASEEEVHEAIRRAAERGLIERGD